MARAHYQKGTALYDLGKYDEAVAEFEAAYEAKSDPALLYNLAQANRLAGHAEQALHFYRTYLKYVPKVANREEIETRIAALEKQIKDKPTTPVASTTSPAVSPPSSFAPPPPPPPPLAPVAPSPSGTATSPGVSPAPANQGMGGGQISMQPSPLASPSSAGPAPLQPVGDLGISSGPVAAPVGRTQRMVGVGLMAGGGAFIAGGVIFGALAVSKSHELESLANTRGVFDPNVQSQGKTYQALQWVFYGVGAAALATGIVVFVQAPSAKDNTTATPRSPALLVTLSPAVGPGSGGAVLQGVF